MTNGLFRKKIFGGLDQADVDEYIQNLEQEMEAGKKQYQKEKAELLRKIAALEEQGTTDFSGNAEEIQAFKEENEELKRKLKDADMLLHLRETVEEEGDERQKSWRERCGALEEENRVLRQSREELEQEKLRLEEEIEKLRQNREDDFFDYSTVTRIIEEAGRNAEMIQREARQKAEKMLKDAEKDLERQKGLITSRINTQLEEKGIQLMAAKYKIEQYAKEIDSVQQGLYGLFARMNKMVDGMPVRLDDYWDEDDQKRLETHAADAGTEKTDMTEKPEG